MLFGPIVVKSLLLIALFTVTRTYNSLYSSPQCAMRLVNESDPGAYSRHPYWKDLHYDDSCAGAALEQYVKNQYYNGEQWWVNLMVNEWTVTGVCLVLWSVFRGKFSIGAVISGFISFIMAYFWAIIVLMHTHFQVDIFFFCGGIIHHANAEKPGIDYKSNSVTEGYLYCGGINRLFYSLALYWLLTRDHRLKRFYNPWLVIGLSQLLLLFALTVVGKNHPKYHEMAINGSTPEMDNAWPYTRAWQAYKHVIVHHDNGLSFSGDVFLDPIWDTFLYAHAFLHNIVFKIQLGSTVHYLFSTVADMVMGLLGVGLLRIGLHFWAFIPLSSAHPKKKLH